MGEKLKADFDHGDINDSNTANITERLNKYPKEEKKKLILAAHSVADRIVGGEQYIPETNTTAGG